MGRKDGKRVGVVLSGCGYLDGSEIHEATLTLLALDRAGAKALAMAPDVDQGQVVDHREDGPVSGERRNVLTESARIARGDISDLATIHATDLDALVFPGGTGAARNLCSYDVDGRDMKVDPQVERLVLEMSRAGKPMGFICIAPVIAAKVLGPRGPRLTAGGDEAVSSDLAALGATVCQCGVEEALVDRSLRLVSTPAYLVGPTIAPIARGIDRLVAELLELA